MGSALTYARRYGLFTLVGIAGEDDRVFERLGRYETAIWRQLRQTIFSLEALRRRHEPFKLKYRTWRQLADDPF